MSSPISETNIVSMSGGKDSTATALVLKELGAPNPQYVFADTGHEHAETYRYIDYLEKALGITIQRVRANFDARIANKRKYIKTHWHEDLYDDYRAVGVSHDDAAYLATLKVQQAMSVLHPTGNPFLDLCLWKGRFPSTRRRFCSEQLKHIPIDTQIIEPAVSEYSRVVSWQGIRADESPSRANLPMWESDFGAGDPETSPGLWIYRPIIKWTVDQVFDMHRRHGIKWNPLYEKGMGRVGCMPCIHAGKQEMREIVRRFPDEVARVKEWERLVSLGSKRGSTTLMDARISAKFLGTGTGSDEVNYQTHGIETYADWAMTARGGRQYDLINAIEMEEAPQCSSRYGLCG